MNLLKRKVTQHVTQGRMGNCRRALQMIMEELEDVDKAIEFAKEQDDAELWEDLISYSIDKPRMKPLRLSPLLFFTSA